MIGFTTVNTVAAHASADGRFMASCFVGNPLLEFNFSEAEDLDSVPDMYWHTWIWGMPNLPNLVNSLSQVIVNRFVLYHDRPVLYCLTHTPEEMPRLYPWLHNLVVLDHNGLLSHELGPNTLPRDLRNFMRNDPIYSGMDGCLRSLEPEYGWTVPRPRLACGVYRWIVGGRKTHLNDDRPMWFFWLAPLDGRPPPQSVRRLSTRRPYRESRR